MAARRTALLSLSRVVGGLPRLILIVIAVLLASHWYWRLSKPARNEVAIERIEEDPRHLASQLAAANLFGKRGEGIDSQASRTAADSIRLVGVAAGGGLALIAVDGKPATAFRIGAEIVPGTKLSKVAPRHVELERGSHRYKLALPDEKWKK